VAQAEQMADKNGRGPGNRADAAAYVAELSADLARIARRHGLDTLGYILDMARLEAQRTSEHSEGSSHPTH
jgi:hypothetical protein